jgi:hypothetical protein
VRSGSLHHNFEVMSLFKTYGGIIMRKADSLLNTREFSSVQLVQYTHKHIANVPKNEVKKYVGISLVINCLRDDAPQDKQ